MPHLQATPLVVPVSRARFPAEPKIALKFFFAPVDFSLSLTLFCGYTLFAACAAKRDQAPSSCP